MCINYAIHIQSSIVALLLLILLTLFYLCYLILAWRGIVSRQKLQILLVLEGNTIIEGIRAWK